MEVIGNMGDDTTTKMFIFLITFWLFAIIFSSYFGEDLVKDSSQLTSHGTTVQYDTLYKVMTFQLTDNVPILLSIFLIALGIFTIWILLSLINPLD